MAVKRVVVHYMHEIERDAALQLVKDPHPTDSFVMGTLDDAQIKTLEDRGLVVQILEETKRPAFERATDAAEAPLAAGAPIVVGSATGEHTQRADRGESAAPPPRRTHAK